jgi:hypothetical protein
VPIGLKRWSDDTNCPEMDMKETLSNDCITPSSLSPLQPPANVNDSAQSSGSGRVPDVSSFAPFQASAGSAHVHPHSAGFVPDLESQTQPPSQVCRLFVDYMRLTIKPARQDRLLLQIGHDVP